MSLGAVETSSGDISALEKHDRFITIPSDIVTRHSRYTCAVLRESRRYLLILATPIIEAVFDDLPEALR